MFECPQLTLFDTVKLGALIDALERVRFNDEGSPRPLQFDFGGLTAKGINSYRGFYDHLALSYQSEPAGSVDATISMLQSAVGQRFHGWKGGEYMMGLDTPVWVAQRGEASSTAIVGLMVESYYVTILTEYVP